MSHDINALGQPVGVPVLNWTPPIHPPSAAMTGRFCRVEPLDVAQHAAVYTSRTHEMPNTATGPWRDPSNFDARGQQRVSLRELTAPILVR